MIYLRLHSSSICNLFLFFICQQLLVDYAESFTKNGSVSTSPARSSEHLSRIYHPQRRQLFMVGDAQGDYYGESSGSYMVKELSLIEELENIVQLASQPIPERPDGIVVVVNLHQAQVVFAALYLHNTRVRVDVHSLQNLHLRCRHGQPRHRRRIAVYRCR